MLLKLKDIDAFPKRMFTEQLLTMISPSYWWLIIDKGMKNQTKNCLKVSVNSFQNSKHALLAQDQLKEYSHHLDLLGLRQGFPNF